MASGYPLKVNGVDIPSSEALYQACRYPHLQEVQRIIISKKSAMAAKMVAKPNRAESRSDWNDTRLEIMRWCLRVKLAQNISTFGSVLASSSDKPIVEDSSRDEKRINHGFYSMTFQ